MFAYHTNGENKNKTKIFDPLTNFCGAYWSDGKFQSSVANPTKPALNERDVTCRQHDIDIANAKSQADIIAANQRFYDSNYGVSLYRTILAILVRDFYPFSYPEDMPGKNKNQKKSNLRGTADIAKLAKQVSKAMTTTSKGAVKTTKTVKQQKQKQKPVTVTTPPVTIGTTMSSMRPAISGMGGGGVRVKGREFITSLPENNQLNWYLSAVIPIHPAYFTSTVISNYAKSYQHWRCHGVTLHYITRQPSSATGEVLMVHTANVSESAFPYNASDFLSRALSCENAVLGPIWTNHSISVKPWGSRGEINAFMDTDINDNIYGEISVFTQSAVSDTAGFLVMDYDFSFETPMYSAHSNRLPISTGVSDPCYSATATTPSTGTQFILNLPTPLSGSVSGTIFKIIINVTGTSFLAPMTAANALNVYIPGSATAVPLQDGTTFYAVVTGTTLRFYSTLSAASTLSTNGQVEYASSTSAAFSWAYTAYQVQFPGVWGTSS